MLFEEIKVKLPTLESLQKKFKKLLDEFDGASSPENQIRTIYKINRFVDEISSVFTVISIHYSQDSRVVEYQKAQDQADEMSPLVQALYNQYQKKLVASKFRKELESKLGAFLFVMTENSLKSFDEKIIAELQQENKLNSQYSKLISSAQIPFEGEVLNLSQLGKYADSLDRNIRKKATQASHDWFQSNEQEIADIYDQLVKLRQQIAVKLGFKNFIEVGYARMGRTDWNASDVKGYRDQIYESVVPLSNKLVRRQSKRIGIRQPLIYDLSLSFASGNPKPRGTTNELVAAAQKMYNEMDPIIGDFFKKMVDGHLLDLEARAGKRGGGYMTYIPLIKMPFVFSNFNGTSGDVDVLTHEIGHAFQGYMVRNFKINEYRDPTMEEAEIHSMSMEFLAWPWVNLFFKEDTDKYLVKHLEDSITFLPYGASIDEFQHWVYENPNASHDERCAVWAEIEKKYTPYKNNKGFPLFEKGARWMRQSHVFGAPFYYIDYTLAQVVAFQFLIASQKDHGKAWKKYLKVCKAGGKYPFTELLNYAKLKNPFVPGAIKKITQPLNKILMNIDDSKF